MPLHFPLSEPDMSDPSVKEAFIELASLETVRASAKPGMKNPYDFGFVPNMSRLLLAHGEIVPKRGMTTKRSPSTSAGAGEP